MVLVLFYNNFTYSRYTLLSLLNLSTSLLGRVGLCRG